MGSVWDTSKQSLTPQLTKQYAQMMELDPVQVTEGVDLAGACILAALAKRVSQENGAQEILDSLAPVPGSVMEALTNGASDAWLSDWFGVGIAKVASWLEDTTEIEVAALLPLAASLVMRTLREAVQSEKLDAAGLSALIHNENDAYAHAHPQLASEINVALDAGENANERAARIRERYTDEEWDRLGKTPLLAAYAVMMSSLSGPIGINKEIAALITALEEYGHSAEPDSLVGLVSHAFNRPAYISTLGANRENAVSLMRDACLECLRILNEKEAHQETQAYKQFVVDVATRVASAARDGGILSIGGRPISDQEQMTLDLIAAALAYQQ